MQDLRELEAFIAVVTHRSLTAASVHLDIPKSTLSRRIRHLEEQLGQPLLRRESNRLLPTEAGYLLADRGQTILDLVARGQAQLDDLKQSITGRLHLSFHNGFTRGWFTQLVETFMSRPTGLQVNLSTCFRVPSPTQGELVVLWLGEAGEAAGFKSQCLGHLSTGVYASPGYIERHGAPRHPDELFRHSWVDTLGETSNGLALFHSQEGWHHRKPRPSTLEVDQLVVQGDAIAWGGGLGLFPNWLADIRLKNHPGTLVRCLPDWQGPAQPVQLLCPYGQLSRRTRTFIDYLLERIPPQWAAPARTPDV